MSSPYKIRKQTKIFNSTGSTSKTTGALLVDGGISSQENVILGGYLGITGTSNIVSIKVQNATTAYNYNLPTSAGSSGDILASGGGGATEMTWKSVTGTGSVVMSFAPTFGAGTATFGGPISGTSASFTGQITSTLASGTAPFVVASTTNIPNLNASSLNGATFASPGSIGSTTRGTGAFTTVNTNNNITISGTTDMSLSISNSNGNVDIGVANLTGNFATNSLIGDTIIRSLADRLLLLSGTGNAPFIIDTSNNINLAALTASTALALNGSKNIVSVTNTGSGNNVLATSPSLSDTITINSSLAPTTSNTTRYTNTIKCLDLVPLTSNSTTYYFPNLEIKGSGNNGVLFGGSGTISNAGDIIIQGGVFNDSANNGTASVSNNAGNVYIKGGVSYVGTSPIAQSTTTTNGSIYFEVGVNDNLSNDVTTTTQAMRISPGGVVNLTNTTASTSNTTGGLLLNGGLGISNTTDASSSTNGGSITTAGGLAVAKKVYIGTDLSVGGTMTTPARIVISTVNAGDYMSAINTGGNDRYGFGQYSGGKVRAIISSTFSGATFGVSKATDSVTSGSAALTDVFTVSSTGDINSTRLSLSGNTNSYSDSVINITNTSTIPSASATMYAPNMTDGNINGVIMGKASSANNSVLIYYNHISTSNSGNSFKIAIAGQAESLTVGYNSTQASSDIYVTGVNSTISSTTTAGQILFGYRTPAPTGQFTPFQVYNNSTHQELIFYVNSRGTSSGLNSVNVNINTASTSTTTGGLLVTGGIGISNTTDATSSTNGGSITTAGGVGIAKSLIVGGGISVSSVVSGTLYSASISGTISINTAQTVNNKLLVLYDPAPSDTLSTATNFYGFGVNANVLRYQSPASATHAFYVSSVQVMKLQADGSMDINGTTGSNGMVQIYSTTTSGKPGDGMSLRPASGGDNNNIINFINASGTARGSITATSTTVTYNTSSDRRLKENIVDIEDAISVVNKLRPVNFKWKSETQEHLKQDNGFIAQEVFDIPEFKRQRNNLNSYTDCECSDNTCDKIDHQNPIDTNGKPLYYSLDYSKFTPYLTKAIQEIIKRVENLEYENTLLKQEISNLKE